MSNRRVSEMEELSSDEMSFATVPVFCFKVGIMERRSVLLQGGYYGEEEPGRKEGII